MKDQLVSFETAKLAKEKGFDELCIYAYKISTKELIDLDTSFDYSECFDDEELLSHLYFSNSEVINNYSITAPTQSLLQRWLREKYKLMIGLVYYQVFGGFWEWRIHYQGMSGKADTYEEALEVGLQKGLKLINNEINRETN